MAKDMDFDASPVLTGRENAVAAGERLCEPVLRCAAGEPGPWRDPLP